MPNRRLGSSVVRYLGDQFPPLQAAILAVAVAVLVVWILSGRIAGDISVDWLLVPTLVTVVLLFLQLRLLDDVHTYYYPTYSSSSEIGGASLAGLIWGVAGTTVAIAAINLPHAEMLATALATTLLMVVCSVVIRMEGTFGPLTRLLAGRVPMFELGPIAALAYVYVAWHTASGESLPVATVAAVVGIVWASFDVWKLTRHLGERPRERVYAITWPLVRRLFLAVSLVCVVVLAREADASTAYLAYAAGVILVFAWLARPRREPDLSRPRWAGLPFPVAMIAEVALQLPAML